MDAYKVEIIESAQREFAAIPFPPRRDLNHKVNSLKRDARPKGCERVGEEELFRVRTAAWVVLYWIDEPRKTVLVLHYRPIR